MYAGPALLLLLPARVSPSHRLCSLAACTRIPYEPIPSDTFLHHGE